MRACERARQHPRFSAPPSGRTRRRVVRLFSLSLPLTPSLPVSVSRHSPSFFPPSVAALFPLSRSLSSLSRSLSPDSSAIVEADSRFLISSASREDRHRTRPRVTIDSRGFPARTGASTASYSRSARILSPVARAISASVRTRRRSKATFGRGSSRFRTLDRLQRVRHHRRTCVTLTDLS